MAEALHLRLKRTVTASLETAVDSLERVSGASLMREAVREVERTVEDTRNRLADAKSEQLRAAAKPAAGSPWLPVK